MVHKVKVMQIFSPAQDNEVEVTYTETGIWPNPELEVLHALAESHDGGCACNRVRYRISGEPLIQLYCFCEDATVIPGKNGFYAGYLVRDSDFRITRQDEQTTYDELTRAGRPITRHACSNCGSNIWTLTEFGLISVAAETLDDPSTIRPGKKVVVQDGPDWARVANELAREYGPSGRVDRSHPEDSSRDAASVQADAPDHRHIA